jgi:predicted CXXCH cytochrome family protein
MKKQPRRDVPSAPRPSASTPSATAQSASRPLPTRSLWIAAALTVLSTLLAAGVWADWYFGLPAEAEAQYIGRQSCLECHQEQHESWTGSHHDLAMDLATDETVIADFNDATLEHYGVTSRMFRRDGKFFIHTEGPDGQMADFEIKYVFGVDPLQQYMVEFDRPADMPASEIARLQVLRVSWDTHAKKWFHLDPPDVREKLAPTDDLHWTGVAQRWNNMCADCHSTNLAKNFDVDSLTYHTTFSEIDVSCEACHGPGSLHVQLAQSPSLFWDRERGYALARLKGTSNVAEVQACAPCHSRRRVVGEGYTAGCNYYDYFSNELLTSTSYHADGQILDEVYEFGSFLQSKMYAKGIRCTDCHDPHTARLKHQGNAVCTSCHQHPAGKYDGAIHHRHADGSTGASCVECHMPQTTYMQVDPRRDHSLRIPRPDLSATLGTPNSCTRCHLRDERLPGPPLPDAETHAAQLRELLAARPELAKNEYADWLALAARDDEAVRAHLAYVDRWAAAATDRWYGVDRKRPPSFAPALHAAREQDPGAESSLAALLDDRDMPAIARASAAMELAAYASPDGAVAGQLASALTERDPQIRAAAMSSVQGLPDPFLAQHALGPLSDPLRSVRVEAGRVLARLPQSDFRGANRPAFEQALAEAFAAADVDNDRAGGHLLRGVLYESLREPDKAEAAYRTAMRVEPTAVGPRSNLSSLLDQRLQAIMQQAQQRAQAGDRAAAEQLVAEAAPLYGEVERLRSGELALLEHDALLLPDSAVLQSRVSFLRYLQGWRKEAETGFLNAHLLDPRSVDFAYSLAIFYRDSGRPREALELVESLRKQRPDDAMIRQFEEELRAQLEGRPRP